MSPSPASRRSAAIVSTGVGRLAAGAVGVVVVVAVAVAAFVLAGAVVLPLSGAAALLVALAVLVVSSDWRPWRTVLVLAVLVWTLATLVFSWSAGLAEAPDSAAAPAPAGAGLAGPAFAVGSLALLVALVLLAVGLLRHRAPRPSTAPSTTPSTAPWRRPLRDGPERAPRTR